MKALTVCQPYASMIVLPDDNPLMKRVENRPRNFTYRGMLAIHAGKSHSWIQENPNEPGFDCYGFKIANLPFGAIVGTCNLVECFMIATHGDGSHTIDDAWLARYPWLATHSHVSGPWCLVLQNVKKLATPIPYRGAQGLFSIPDHLFD